MQVAQTNSTVFNDILTGDNSCSELASVCCEYGFPAALGKENVLLILLGYDAVTGLGSVNYNELLAILMGF